MSREELRQSHYLVVSPALFGGRFRAVFSTRRAELTMLDEALYGKLVAGTFAAMSVPELAQLIARRIAVSRDEDELARVLDLERSEAAAAEARPALLLDAEGLSPKAFFAWRARCGVRAVELRLRLHGSGAAAEQRLARSLQMLHAIIEDPQFAQQRLSLQLRCELDARGQPDLLQLIEHLDEQGLLAKLRLTLAPSRCGTAMSAPEFAAFEVTVLRRLAELGHKPALLPALAAHLVASAEADTPCRSCHLLPVCGGATAEQWENSRGTPCPSIRHNLEQRLLLQIREDRRITRSLLVSEDELLEHTQPAALHSR
ncbi:hypothetical protein RQP53_23470 [Paucibacter sp. APW11]|uniref:Uncharacterized protein n=1 Tax=Roseateles aquae TaxID=3077235 RepID=A0ABU3PI50_9BURK|nr:hypothetical protein [Paucibacter sp. APW11]MDT9002260.1 hypothetical protein [Paucibacter sp. APW11]